MWADRVVGFGSLVGEVRCVGARDIAVTFGLALARVYLWHVDNSLAFASTNVILTSILAESQYGMEIILALEKEDLFLCRMAGLKVLPTTIYRFAMNCVRRAKAQFESKQSQYNHVSQSP